MPLTFQIMMYCLISAEILVLSIMFKLAAKQSQYGKWYRFTPDLLKVPKVGDVISYFSEDGRKCIVIKTHTTLIATTATCKWLSKYWVIKQLQILYYRHIKTWHIELFVVWVILSTTTFIFNNNVVGWITFLAVLYTFQCQQISDRLQEREGVKDKPQVECYRKFNVFFVRKEILWIIVFIMLGSYPAIVGSVIMGLYPYWRKYYRKIKPIK